MYVCCEQHSACLHQFLLQQTIGHSVHIDVVVKIFNCNKGCYLSQYSK